MILFLSSSSKSLGIGNIKRCEYLRNELVKKRIKCFSYYERKLNIKKIINLIEKKKIKNIIIDDYKYKEKHRKIFKELGCKIIQINYFNDNDKYIDLFINYLKKKTKKTRVINDISYAILKPYTKFNFKKKDTIMIYLSNVNLKDLKRIVLSISLNFKDIKIIVISNYKFNQIIKIKKYHPNVTFFRKKNNLNQYLNRCKILISGGGLISLEGLRYKVQNIVIYSNLFQNVNSQYLIKKKFISFRTKLQNLDLKKLIQKINFLLKKPKKLKSIEKNSVKKTALILVKEMYLKNL